MSTIVVHPGTLSGRLRAPPSKSYTHRALVAGYLAGRRYEVRRPLDADDTRATRLGLERLGAHVTRTRDRWTITPAEPGRPRRRIRIECGESGTSFRLLAALAAVGDRPVEFVGADRLARRPIEGLVDSLRHGGARITHPAGRSLPLRVEGPIRSGPYALDATVSSQYASALLLTLPTLDGASRLTLKGRPVSEPYIAATLAVLRAHRIRIEEGPGTFTIAGPQRYHGRGFDVPGDASSAAYLWAGAAVGGGRVAVTGVPDRWPQADRRVLAALTDAGASVRPTGDGATVAGPVRTGFDVDLTGSPDLYPLLGAVAAVIPARSTLRGAAHVVHKESDRKQQTIRLVRAIGGTATEARGGLVIRGTGTPRALRLSGLDDHRLVMSAAVAALAAGGPSRIQDGRAVHKSFPGFWRTFRALGARAGSR